MEFTRQRTTKAIGDEGEALALAHLQRAGLVLVERNYRVARGPHARGGEVDLILRERDGTLVFAEVRARAGANHGGAAASVGAAKQRRIVLAYDSANRYLRAWRFDAHGATLTPLWEKSPFGCASHMILYPDTGEVVINDYRRQGEEVVVLAIESGQELARVRTGGLTQGVVFPSAGWGRDFYWSSMGRLARVFVQ